MKKLERQPELEQETPTSTRFLGDAVVQETIKEDPLIIFLKDFWQRWSNIILLVLIVAAISFWAYKLFNTAYQQRLHEAADQYQTTLDLYEEYGKVDQQLASASKALAADSSKPELQKALDQAKKSKEEVKLRLEQVLNALADSQSPYNHIAELYRILLARSTAQATLASFLKTGLVQNWQTIDSKNPDRFFAELSALALAQGLLDNDQDAAQGQELLNNLVKNGTVVQAAAARVLARLAQSPEQRAAAKVLIEDLVSKHPEQATLLKEDLDRLS